MSKRTLCVAALWVANILLLAHIAIPHHHHGDDVKCCFDFHCKDCSHKPHDSQTHQHERNPFSEKCCFIDNVYTLAENNIKTACHIHTKCDCRHILFTLISDSLHLQFFCNNTITHFRQNPYIPLFYADFVAQSIGLRAPPVC